jgi:hypothetical protein
VLCLYLSLFIVVPYWDFGAIPARVGAKQHARHAGALMPGARSAQAGCSERIPRAASADPMVVILLRTWLMSGTFDLIVVPGIVEKA